MDNPIPEAQISPLAKVFEEVPAQSVFIFAERSGKRFLSHILHIMDFAMCA